jgi:hypothetical protein
MSDLEPLLDAVVQAAINGDRQAFEALKRT